MVLSYLFFAATMTQTSRLNGARFETKHIRAVIFFLNILAHFFVGAINGTSNKTNCARF